MNKDKMSVVVDYRINKEHIYELERLGCRVIPTKPIEALYGAVRGHADMQIHFSGGKAVCEPTVYEYYQKMLSNTDIICGSAKLTDKYPYDIAYNTCKISKYAIANAKYTAKEILSQYNDVLNTRQGYAKCNICVVSDTAAITSDEGIYRLLLQNGIDTLKIRGGYIELKGMSGFIGGASGLIKPNLLTFNGDINTHPDGKNIISFCKNYGVDAVSLGKDALCDIGSILRVI